MALLSGRITAHIGTTCRNVAVAVIAGVYRQRSAREVNSALKARPTEQQAAITAAVLGLLLAGCLFAAQFGWIGMLVFWLAVIVLVN